MLTIISYFAKLHFFHCY